MIPIDSKIFQMTIKKRSRANAFGLEPAPTVYPTRLEFSDPLRYIESLHSLGQQYGIVKIVPPKFWKPPLSLNYEDFYFSTRKQCIREMNGASRARRSYNDRIVRYHLSITGKDVSKHKLVTDFYILWKLVQDFGGPAKVTRLNKWNIVAHDLKLSNAAAVKAAYDSVIQPYNLFCRKYRKFRGIDRCVCSYESEYKLDSESLELVECSDCNVRFHRICYNQAFKANVPLESIDVCIKCILGTGDFGFEDGAKYNLDQFRKKADKFKSNYFGDSGITSSYKLATKVEKAFWAHFEDEDSDLTVEYGADIHNVTGFCQDPSDFYSKDPWNLNKFAYLNNSLLKYCKSDISGMTVPWLYVGMCFSAFCWHAEDHFTYSINYQHFGDIKTWYGVSGDHAGLLESTIKNESPDLVDQQPDLMLQLVTLMSPDKLRHQGVQVYYADQHENEFIITFPRAYHAGINHGFNINEAVNFALPNWATEGYALSSILMYRDYARQPCFSHDELFMNIFLNSKSSKNNWLYPIIEQIISSEVTGRKAFSHCESVSLSTLEQCKTCKTFLYISAIKQNGSYYCMMHADKDQPCEIAIRYTNQQLIEYQAMTKVKPEIDEAAQSDKWSQLYKQFKASLDSKFPLHLLHRLIQTAPNDNIRSSKEYSYLLDLNAKAEKWIDEFTNSMKFNNDTHQLQKLKIILDSFKFESPETLLFRSIYKDDKSFLKRKLIDVNI